MKANVVGRANNARICGDDGIERHGLFGGAEIELWHALKPEAMSHRRAQRSTYQLSSDGDEAWSL